MKALAEFLVDIGYHVSGSDGDPDPAAVQSLSRLGVHVRKGHSSSHLQPRPNLLIYSAAVPADNPEREAARQLRIPQYSYIESLASLTHSRDAVAIAGTHGKSTTTAMLGQILKTAGTECSLLCGAESKASRRSGWAGTGEVLVVEACEFRRHFWDLHPRIGCILGVEPDHFDCYPSLADTERAYHEFARRVLKSEQSFAGVPPTESKTGTLILSKDCPAVRRVAEGLSGQIRTFSLHDPEADWRAVPDIRSSGQIHFHIEHQGTISESIFMQVPGLHNVRNALAAAACAGELGMSLPQIVAGLQQFEGLTRRFEVRGEWRGAVVVDDYAHHPTEIRATLEAARLVYPKRKIICLFQPHQLSRTSVLLTEFAAALSQADKAYLLPVYAAREQAGKEQVRLVEELVKRMTIPARLISALDQVWGTVQTDADKDAVFLTLGAGNLSRIHYDEFERVE